MLANKHILILGGDSRFLYLIASLKKQNCKLTLIGYDEYSFSSKNIKHASFQAIDFSIYQAIILPVGGTSETGEIVPTYSKQSFFLTAEKIKQTNEDCIIFTGIKNKFLTNITERANRRLVALFERDDVAILNSVPTAEATLKLAIKHTKFTLANANILILGFGRVGFTTARLFHNVGGHVTVAIRNTRDFARIKAMQMKPIYLHTLKDNLDKMQIIINTIPHLVLTRKLIKKINKEGLIIDLASIPGGTNFSAAKDYRIQALHALGLPGKTAPQTAGDILFQTIKKLLIDPKM